MVTRAPGVASDWERDANIEDVRRIAQVADDLGFDYLTCSEHIAVPSEATQHRGSTYWDPLATLAFLAANTSRIRLATSVIVLGYHHPLAIAKRYGTLDRISCGRLVLGVGVGSLAAEFDLLDAPWDERGARADDAIRALRASLSTPRPSYDGEYFAFHDLVVEPCALQAHVPIWVGGRTLRSLRRAAALGDGWMPFGLRPVELAAYLAAVDLPPSFDVVPASAPLDPSGARSKVGRHLSSLVDAGATGVTCIVKANSADHFCAQLATLREVVSSLFE